MNVSMKCNEFLDQLDSWMEGERSPEAREHVRSCADCRGLADDLSAIQQAAPMLVADDTEPPARLWASLRAELEREGLISSPAPVSARHSWWRAPWLAVLHQPAFAIVYLALLVAAAFAFSVFPNSGLDEISWIRNTQNATMPLSAQLDTAEQSAISSFANSPSLVSASLHQNLAVVDNYIALCEKSVREEPEDEMARDFLYQAYQQKADLLAQMSERGEPIQ